PVGRKRRPEARRAHVPRLSQYWSMRSVRPQPGCGDRQYADNCDLRQGEAPANVFSGSDLLGCSQSRSLALTSGCHWRDKAVPSSRNRFNISRLYRIIIKSLAYPIHRFVQRLIEINKGIGSPDTLSQLLTCND